MGFAIRLEGERGVVKEQLLDLENTLSRLLPSWEDPSFHCLRYIDPYGNTVFNHLQMDEFIEELKRIRAVATTEVERAFVDSIESMAIRCKESGELYIRFRGD